jgi:hypothetical protein
MLIFLPRVARGLKFIILFIFIFIHSFQTEMERGWEQRTFFFFEGRLPHQAGR